MEASVAADILETVGKWIGGGITSAHDRQDRQQHPVFQRSTMPTIVKDLNDIITTQNKILAELSDIEDEVIYQETAERRVVRAPRRQYRDGISTTCSHLCRRFDITGAELTRPTSTTGQTTWSAAWDRQQEHDGDQHDRARHAVERRGRGGRLLGKATEPSACCYEAYDPQHRARSARTWTTVSLYRRLFQILRGHLSERSTTCNTRASSCW